MPLAEDDAWLSLLIGSISLPHRRDTTVSLLSLHVHVSQSLKQTQWSLSDGSKFNIIYSSYFLDKENHTHVTNLTFPQVDELLTAEQVSSTSQSKNLEISYRFNCKSLVEEWTELDDFPSSDDLSVFLADLDAIAITKFHPSLRTPCTKDSLLKKFSDTHGRTSFTLRSNDLMTSKNV